MLLDRIVEVGLCILDILGNLGQIRQLQRRSISLDNLHQVHTVEMKLIVFNVKFFCGEIKGLLDEINVLVHGKWGNGLKTSRKNCGL